MNDRRFVFALLALSVPWLAACDGQQYVSPDTVALSIQNAKTSTPAVSDCSFVPVLLGDEVKTSYAVDGDLSATLTLRRDSFSVVFGGSGSGLEPFVATAADVLAAAQTAASPPAGYTVTLSSGCTPKVLP